MKGMPNGKCDRCGKESNEFTMSWFNTDWLCPECSEKEKKHPRYEEARKAENDAVRHGDYNFPGIGYPGKA